MTQGRADPPTTAEAEAERTADYDRIAEYLAKQKADGTVRQFDSIDAIREAAQPR
jgi:hypothetical protein